MIVVIVLSLTLVTALALAEGGIVGAKDDRLRTNRIQALFSASACAEVALLSLRDSGSLAGSISDAPIECTYSIMNLGGETYSVHATGTKSAITRSVSITASFDGSQVLVSNWSNN